MTGTGDAADGRDGSEAPCGAAVSVVIPTFNRRERLQRVLGGLAAQAYDGALEVVVVSDGSTDGTAEHLASGATPLPVVALVQPNSGPAVARNRGVEGATGELVIFLDDDVVPGPSLVAAHVAAHRRLGADVVVIGPMLDPPDHPMSPWVRWEQAMLAKQYDAMERGDWAASARQFYTGNASVRRQQVLAAGGFDARFLRAEDTELAYRLADAGATFAFEPAAIALHYAERTFVSWRSVADSYGRTVVFLASEGRPHILELAIEEFGDRNVLLRGLIRIVVGRPRARTGLEWTLRATVEVADRVRLVRVARFAMSALNGVVYYDALADELGGRRALLDLLDRGARSAAAD